MAKEQNDERITLQDLNIAVQTWFSFEVNNEEYNIPLLIHIKDIDDYREEIIPYKIDILRKDFRINKLENPFHDELLEYNILESMDYYLKFIDNRKIFKNEDGKRVSFLETLNCDIKDVIDESIFMALRDEILYYVNYVKIKFIEKCKELLEYQRNFPKQYTPKDNKLPEDVKENIRYPLGMTMMQGDIEYPSNVIFEENIGKCVTRYSWRETQLKAMYLHMKNSIEGFLNTYQSWKMEQDRPKTK